MRKILFSILLLLLAANAASAALSYGQSYYVQNRGSALSGGGNDPLFQHIGEVEGVLEGTTAFSGYIAFDEIAAPSGNPSSNDVWLYAKDNAGTSALYVEVDDGTVIQLSAGTGDNTLDNAYDQGGAGAGGKINADTVTVEIEVADGSNNTALLLDADDATNDPTVLLITNAADAANAISIDIDAQSTGRDIEGTGATWYVTGAGVMTVADIQGTTGTITTLGSTTANLTTANITTANVTNAMSLAGNLTLDDGVGASPSFTLTDATNETVVFSKADSGDMSVTIAAADSVTVTTGNLRVGNGSPGTAPMDGEDFYCEGQSEFDGAMQVDGLATITSAAIATAQVTTLLNVDEDVDIDFDNADEEMTVVNSAQYGADGAQVTIENTDADVTAAMYLLRLRYTDDGQANADFAVFEDNNGDDQITFTDGGAITAVGTVTGATIKATTLLDVDEAVDIDLDANDEEVRIDSAANDYAAGSGILEIYDDSTGQTNASYLLRLIREANGDAQDHFILCEDNSTGADNNGDDMFAVTSGGSMTIAGTATFSGGQTRMVRFDPKVVELDGTNPPALTDFGTDAQTNISVLAFDADGGATGDDIAYISWKVPDGYVTDSARLNIAYTFSTAEDAADEAQFDFAVNSVAAGEALDAAGTALADQATVITDASADNGKLHITQYNIEVEDIVIDDLVTIEIAVDESESALSASGTLDVLYIEIEYESTE